MDRGRLPDPRSKASIAPSRPCREVKAAGSRFWPAAARAVICLYTASRDSSYLTRPGSGMYSPLESRVGVASCSRVIYPRGPMKSHTTKFHAPGQGACNTVRVEAADDVQDERFPAHLSTRPKLLHTLAVRKG